MGRTVTVGITNEQREALRILAPFVGPEAYPVEHPKISRPPFLWLPHLCGCCRGHRARCMRKSEVFQLRFSDMGTPP